VSHFRRPKSKVRCNQVKVTYQEPEAAQERSSGLEPRRKVSAHLPPSEKQLKYIVRMTKRLDNAGRMPRDLPSIKTSADAAKVIGILRPLYLADRRRTRRATR